jgi:hypothetical protein
MNDIEDFERRLQRYRPAGPPEALRARVVRDAGNRAAARRQTALEWIPAAAAAAAAALFALLAQRAQADIANRVRSVGAARADAVSALVVTLGGDELLRPEAERIVADLERREAEPVAAASARIDQGSQ